MAHLLTCGQKWRVRSSSNAQSQSVVRSPSDGPESPQSPLTAAMRGTLWSVGSPSDGCRLMERGDPQWSHQEHTIVIRRAIRRLAFFRKETTIDARSWPDCRGSWRQRRHSWMPYDRNSIALQSKLDRSAIVARSPRDRGPIAK